MDLLEQWQSIYREAIQLAEAVERLPEACECGDADAHLEGRCRCCASHEPTGEHHGSGENCSAILARLRADVTMFSHDFSTMLSLCSESIPPTQRVELRRGIFLAAGDLEQIVDAFRGLNSAVVGFRRNCALTEMRRLKHQCAQLREHCERVNMELAAKYSQMT
ncbi:MAG: hypothetical protein HY644_06520 [Acidobacteria bacterium]|nr:hypothetical protein [Acidobacteriota bacterium]